MKTIRLVAALALMPLFAAPALAQQASVRIVIKDHKFSPAEPHAPANRGDGRADSRWPRPSSDSD